jgi:hypothetical protein
MAGLDPINVVWPDVEQERLIRKAKFDASLPGALRSHGFRCHAGDASQL